MDDREIKTFMNVWILAVASLCYSYFIAGQIPKGALRLISILPVVFLFIILPLNFSAFHLGAPTAFFLAWLGNFKLLLFSFGEGPLVQAPNLLLFISTACLPIKIKQKGDPLSNSSNSSSECRVVQTSSIYKIVLTTSKVVLLALIFKSYIYKPYLHPYVILALYCVHMYLELELLLAVSAIPARALLGLEFEPQMNEPYLSTSLQDFWGRRWNLMVTSILRPTVYHPVQRISTRILGHNLASLSAVIATFAVSGLMHELIYYYLARVHPTWEVTWFFVLHGVCVGIEMAVKRSWGSRRRLHGAVSGPLTLLFLAVTGRWLFFPQLTRNGVDERAIQEYFSFLGFLKNKVSMVLQL